MITVLNYLGLHAHQENAIAYAATTTLAVADGAFQTMTLSGNITLNVGVGSFNGQQIVVRITGDVALTRTITWGGNILASASTFSITNAKNYTFTFNFYGTKWELINTPTGL